MFMCSCNFVESCVRLVTCLLLVLTVRALTSVFLKVLFFFKATIGGAGKVFLSAGKRLVAFSYEERISFGKNRSLLCQVTIKVVGCEY